MQFPKSDYKEYPKTLAKEDFWGQVRRTVHGKPVSEEQIRMIVDAIRAGMALQSSDRLLDLACGNGALSRYFFDSCTELHGVDYSEYLIEVAKSNFENLPRFSFACSDAAGYVRAEADPARFTKVLCYGSFSFFPAQDAVAVLSVLRERFAAVRTVYIGNLPDKDRAEKFFPEGMDFAQQLDDHASQIGIWRSRDEFTQLCAACGWRARFHRMPADFFGAHYRYDVVLTPLAE